jgi:hypothetical protein
MYEYPMDEISGGRLLAHIMATDTRWFRVSAALLNFGRNGVPETRDSYNPVKWLAAQAGAWMSDRQIRSTNRRYDREQEQK